MLILTNNEEIESLLNSLTSTTTKSYPITWKEFRNPNARGIMKSPLFSSKITIIGNT